MKRCYDKRKLKNNTINNLLIKSLYLLYILYYWIKSRFITYFQNILNEINIFMKNVNEKYIKNKLDIVS